MPALRFRVMLAVYNQERSPRVCSMELGRARGARKCVFAAPATFFGLGDPVIAGNTYVLAVKLSSLLRQRGGTGPALSKMTPSTWKLYFTISKRGDWRDRCAKSAGVLRFQRFARDPRRGLAQSKN